MIKKLTMYFVVIMVLSGCAEAIGKDSFLHQIDQLEHAMDQPNWSEVATQAKELKEVYEGNKWKLQLIGDEGEYEGLNQSIHNIIAAAKEKDAPNARVEIATTKSLVKDIYSL